MSARGQQKIRPYKQLQKRGYSETGKVQNLCGNGTGGILVAENGFKALIELIICQSTLRAVINKRGYDDGMKKEERNITGGKTGERSRFKHRLQVQNIGV